MNGEAEADIGSWAHKILKEVMKYGAIKSLVWCPQTIGTCLLRLMTFLIR